MSAQDDYKIQVETERQDALEKQKRLTRLVSKFAEDHPRADIRDASDLNNFMRSHPGEVEGWVANQSDIPIEERGVQALASAYAEVNRLEEMGKHPPTLPDDTKNPNPAALFTLPFALINRNAEVKQAEQALSEASPDISLYDFVPSEIAQNTSFQEEVAQIEKQKVEAYMEDFRKKYPNKKLTDDDIAYFLEGERRGIERNALDAYANTSQRADTVKLARENDVYLKNTQGQIIGERIFKDKKNKANPYLDPVYMSYQAQKRQAISRALQKRKEEREKGIKHKEKDSDVKLKIALSYDMHFASLFPEKAEAYAKVDPRLKASLKLYEKAEKRIENREVKQAKTVQSTRGTNASTGAQTTNTPKTATNIQRKWIKSKLEKARLAGYDRFWLVKKLRDLKVWGKRTWKAGETGIKPAKNAYQHLKTGSTGVSQPRKLREQKSVSISPLDAFKLSRENNSSFFGTTWNNFASSRISTANRNLGRTLTGRTKKVASSAARKGASKLLSKGTTQLVATGAKAVIASPVFWVILAILAAILFIIGVVLLVTSDGDGGGGNAPGGIPPGGIPPKNTNPIPGFSLEKAVSAEVLPDTTSEITYTLTFSLPSSIVSIETTAVTASDITIHDTVPDNTTLVESKTTGNYTLSSDGKTISWALSDPVNAAITSVSFTVQPTSTDVTISNYAWADANSTSLPPGTALPPTTDTCEGKYPLPPEGNFGDPACTFTKDDLYNALKSQDPTNADYWYLKIIPCESGYSPNAYLAASTSGLGAYGLFQMNPSGRGNGEYDAGNVNWPLQINNAINYNKLINGSFAYWACK